MQHRKNTRLGLGFLVLLGTPPYLVYDVHRIIGQEGSTFFQWFNLVVAGGAIIASILWLFSLRGEDYMRVKSYFENLLGLIVLVVSSPLLLLTAILIKLESDGPAVYSQKRVGRNFRKGDRRRSEGPGFSGYGVDIRKRDRRGEDIGGKPFTIYKLRSMTADAEKQTGVAWSTGDYDPRVTRVGHFIRKTHLDEVPQFFNVMLGQMSMIGPRPERPAFVAKLSREVAGYHDRLAAPPGITGLAQVRQASDETLEDVRKKLEFDREYVKGASLYFDIKIALQTVALVLSLLVSAFGGRASERIEPKAADGVIPDAMVARHR
jgi:lipopolysaccharide/colanic/teichoic acid biosynthesis glycosyltransferase